jgi:7,8-dihydropterin-6-yl-methyl-4-(beta-D-ribofuranosyl)aminobenzene 5'-phosphate synthase
METFSESAGPSVQLSKLQKRSKSQDHRIVPVRAKGKELVVLSGWVPVGIVNPVEQSQRIAGTDKFHAVVDKFLLINVKPDHIVPTHCTGFEAIVSFAKVMPEEFIANTAETPHGFGA